MIVSDANVVPDSSSFTYRFLKVLKDWSAVPVVAILLVDGIMHRDDDVSCMGHCPDCGRDLESVVLSDTDVVSGVVYECPECGAILGVSDALDM